MPFNITRFALACAIPFALAATSAYSQNNAPGSTPSAPPGAPPSAPQGATHSGKLLLTGGVSSIDGAAGGGLTPWAVTGGYGTNGEFGGSGFATRIETNDYALTDYGVAFAYSDRIELSFARQSFNTGPVAGVLAGILGPSFNGLHLKQDIFGVKLKVVGDAVLDSDSLMPQIAIGLQYKKADSGPLKPVLESFGAKDHGTDIYISATKLFLAQGILVNGTLRATKANQNGLLGFGATDHTKYTLQPEVSVALLLRKNIAVGVEYRAKPDNLRDNTALGPGVFKEDDWADLFVAWAPTKNVSLTVAYVDLGKIVPGVVNKRQTGGYVSAQLSF